MQPVTRKAGRGSSRMPRIALSSRGRSGVRRRSRHETLDDGWSLISRIAPLTCSLATPGWGNERVAWDRAPIRRPRRSVPGSPLISPAPAARQVSATPRTETLACHCSLLLQGADTNRRYEVEIQLGPTDESHIIRTIGVLGY